MLYVLYVLTSCLGLYFLKAAPGWNNLTFLLGFTLYGFGALQWILILRLTPLSLAFPIAAGALMIGSVFTGVFFLGEVINFWHILGAVLIFSGMALMVCLR